MKSNRMRLSKPPAKGTTRFAPGWLLPLEQAKQSEALDQMPAPLPIGRIEPDQIIEDILVSTLSRVKNSANAPLAAAAARYITLLREKAV
jgi:hypothetical protein